MAFSRDQRARRELLGQIAEHAVEADTCESLVERSAVIIAGAAGAGCLIALDAAGDGRLHPIGLHHPDCEFAPYLQEIAESPFDPSPMLRGALRGEQVYVEGIRPDDARAAGSPFRQMGERVGSTDVLAVPLAADGTPQLGVLALGSFGAAPLERADVGVAEAAARLLAVFVERALARDAAEPASAPATPARAGKGPLSVREREVLALLARGHTNREAAEQLYLSVRTVEWHRARLQWKLGVSTRAELLTAARRLGLGP